MSKSTSVRNFVFLANDEWPLKRVIIERIRSIEDKRELYAVSKSPSATEATQEATRA